MRDHKIMGKTFAGSHKAHSSKRNCSGSSDSSHLLNGKCKLNIGLRGEKARFYDPGGVIVQNDSQGKENRGVNGINKTKCIADSALHDDSYEVWCICRLLKPCQQCKERRRTEREKTPTPGCNLNSSFEDLEGSKSSCVTPTSSNKVYVEHVTDFVRDTLSKEATSKSGDGNLNTRENSRKNSSHGISSANGFETTDNKSDGSETTGPGINLTELFEKLDELNAAHDATTPVFGEAVLHLADTPPGTPTSSMDTASTCSFDHFDFDTSFCSLKSTDMMEHGDLADQLSLVQQMVVEMKTGFSRAMEELSKIQYGDQTLQQQLADNTKHCNEEITTVKESIEQLKAEMLKLSGHLQEVSDTQRNLQDKLDNYHTDKSMLLEELERSGAISVQTRTRLSGGCVSENNNTIPADVAPMVHPYLNSLQSHHKVVEDYNSDSSLTAAVSRSLNLTQALGEKCLNLDISTTSSEDEDNSRQSNSRSGSGHRAARKQRGSFQYEDNHRTSQKIPPHEQVLEEVHREEAARDIVDVEREYCSQLWTLLEDYMNPLRDETVVGRREFQLLFPPYIPQIYEHHCILLRKMEERLKKWKTSGVIGDVFAKFTESMEGDGLCLYKEFINDFPTVINTMNKWFLHSANFRELMQSQCLANSSVLQLLLAPLQQVPKYSILLKNLLKYTPVDHADRYYLESSLARLKQFLYSMNDDLEHAMQAINMNNQPVNRARDAGNSARSKSSASSGEANHVSRDSGVHSNEEEHAKSPMSPNTARRYLLQQLREKREQRQNEKSEGRLPTPRGRKQSGYGSHPDLTNHASSPNDGRRSPYLASLSQSKMFSSLSKLPLPRENSNSRKGRSKKPDGYRSAINPHYLRPLTPQVFPTSTSAHTFDAAKRREEYAERMHQRPASAMEFSYSLPDQQDEYLELLAHQAGITISPPHSSSSERSRQEMQKSLHKLLVETGNQVDDFSDQEQDGNVEPISYHKQFLATKQRILKHRENNPLPVENLHDDFGMCGDEEDDENDLDDTEIKPMKLLQDSHRPKIMVPKWRQSASPHTTNYTNSVASGNRKTPTGTSSEATLAASLAQSLFDAPKQTTLPREKKSKDLSRASFDGTTDQVPNKGSLKRTSTGGPVESPIRQNAVVTDGKNGVAITKSLSFDRSPNRPKNLTLSNQHSVTGSLNSNKQISPNGEGVGQLSMSHESEASKRNSVTKLSDVIAYTADCLENSELKKMQSENDNEIPVGKPYQRTLPERPGGKLSVTDILSNTNMKVSSVDTVSSPGVSTSGESEKDNEEISADSDSNVMKDTQNEQGKAGTDSLVFYFQNRDKINQDTMEKLSPDSHSRIPTFISMNKTSTPIHEHKVIGSQVTSGARTVHGSLAGKQKVQGRLVRSDEAENKASGRETSEPGKTNTTNADNDMTADKQEGATKERVLKAVDQLRLSFERKKALTEERRQGSSQIPLAQNPVSPIQKQFNDISKNSKVQDQKSLMLRTLSSPSQASSPIGDLESPTRAECGEQRRGLYKKAGRSKSPTKYQADSSASARHIQKLERATSPTGRSTSPSTLTNPFEKFKTQNENANQPRPIHGPHNGQRNSFESSLIPQRSKSPTRVSVERERPKSTTDFSAAARLEDKDEQPLKSAMKETKIPVLKKASSGPLSKSSEDLTKIKKKSPFKELKNLFGRKKKKQKLCSNSDHDHDNCSPQIPVTMATYFEPSFQNDDDDDGGLMFIPLSSDRRSNSTSQILQCYKFEEDEPVSAV